jgi:hypothetical protein
MQVCDDRQQMRRCGSSGTGPRQRSILGPLMLHGALAYPTPLGATTGMVERESGV